MEISNIGRPRNVGWVRAAALLYGDWGTSKAYVIGLALAAVGFAALPHLLAVCALTGLVGINYVWVCKHFPNGGGVYTAAGLHSRRLATIGGLLLLADFIVTAALSCLDGFHYLGFAESAMAKKCAIMAIFVIGAINFLGPKHTGGIAVWLAIPTVVMVLALIAGGAPHIAQFHPQPPSGSVLGNWATFVGMILALSGVEVAASSTGVLKLDPGASLDKPSVFLTARRAIWAVMLDVVIGTALLAVLAMCLPAEAREHPNDMLRYMGEVFIGPHFARLVGWVFGALLISAVNTAITGMVALLYVMARDGELPDTFLLLNRFGVPWVALITATVLPVVVLNIDDKVQGLAALYAIGVVGAIAINLGSCAFAQSIDLSRARAQHHEGHLPGDAGRLDYHCPEQALRPALRRGHPGLRLGPARDHGAAPAGCPRHAGAGAGPARHARCGFPAAVPGTVHPGGRARLDPGAAVCPGRKPDARRAVARPLCARSGSEH